MLHQQSQPGTAYIYFKSDPDTNADLRFIHTAPPVKETAPEYDQASRPESLFRKHGGQRNKLNDTTRIHCLDLDRGKVKGTKYEVFGRYTRRKASTQKNRHKKSYRRLTGPVN